MEAAYDIFHMLKQESSQQLIAFARYERLDMNSSIPSNGIADASLNQSHLITGFGYLPINDVVVKADLRFQHTAKPDPALTPASANDDANNTFFNLGIGFSF